MKALGRKRKTQDKGKSKNKPKKRVVYEAEDLEEAKNAAIKDRESRHASEANLPLAKRVALQKEKESMTIPIKSKFGSKEIAYVPKSDRKKKEEGKGSRRGNRRGIKDLGLKRQKF